MRCRLGILLFGLFAFPAAPWQVEAGFEKALLNRIRQRMKENLSRIPNYTCLETITRGRRVSPRLELAVPGKSLPFHRLDVVRLEVAEVGRTELYARVGEHAFQTKEPSQLVTGGMMGNGIFSTFAHNIFISTQASFEFRGEEPIEGRTYIRYDYSIPQVRSGYRINTTLGSAVVGYHGSFWADPQSFDVARLEIVADDIPPALQVTVSLDRIDYARVRIGAADALLPQYGEVTMRQDEGSERRNQISFTHCREYGVQTVVSFEDAGGGASGAGTNFVELPPGLPLTLRLQTPIDSSAAHIGDVLGATVEADARQKGTLVVPKGAAVSGRLRRLEQHREGLPYMLMGLEFTQIDFNGKQARFFAELERISLPSGLTGPRRVVSRELPGVGMISAAGNRLVLLKGTRMTWKTISYAQASETKK